MNKNKIYILEDRGLLYVQGDDVKEFLQNIISNDVYKVSDNFSCYASLLTPQGKYLFDFIILIIFAAKFALSFSSADFGLEDSKLHDNTFVLLSKPINILFSESCIIV